MTKEARIITVQDMHSLSDFLRLAEEVRSTKAPTVLRRDGEDLVELRPTRRKGRRARRTKAAADIAAFRSAAGGWVDIVDGEDLKTWVASGRSSGARTLADLA